MPDEKDVFVVKIKRLIESPSECEIDRPFLVRPGGRVKFDFLEPGALIFFPEKSPFGPQVFKPGPMTVQDSADGHYDYFVLWPDGGGLGASSGEVIPD